MTKLAQVSVRLHAFCLSSLQRMAPANRVGFRNAVAGNPQLKKKLELEMALSVSSATQRSSLAANSTPKTTSPVALGMEYKTEKRF